MTDSDRDADAAKKGVNPFAQKDGGGKGDGKKSSGGFVGAIKDRDALKNALKVYAKMPPALQPSRKAAIIKAAKALGATFMLPKDWAAELAGELAGELTGELTGEHENADKMHDPKGGLSAQGRKKFNSQGSNLKPGVTSYNGASEADKKRWVRWALRFTKSARPLKKPNGDPTPYAKMFTAWGRPVPKNADDVKATYNLALTRKKSLGMGDAASLGGQVLGIPEDFFLAPCPDPDCAREFLDIDTALTHVERVHTDV